MSEEIPDSLVADDDRPRANGWTRRDVMKAILVGAAALGVDFARAGDLLVIPNSEGFLLVDRKKCQGCCTCMMACGLAHGGTASYSLARIQIEQDSFARFPDDIYMAQCRQCQDAPCVEVCPTGANHADSAFGNVRMVDAEKCIGCKSCIAACPWLPHRNQWDKGSRKAQKCDLCANTPALRSIGEKGGPGGMQTCVRVCPLNAIAFTRVMPDQKSDDSYQANLRGRTWAALGMTTK
jgi:protein NrfC